MRTLPFFKPKNKPQFAGLNVSDASSGGGGGGDTSSLVNKSDITPIILIGTTNTSGNVISAGTWFYLNGTPCIAKVDIASGATFTEGTNYEEKTIWSALSELNSNTTVIDYAVVPATSTMPALTFVKFSNGIKRLKISSPSVVSTAVQYDNVVPSGYSPYDNDARGYATSWNDVGTRGVLIGASSINIFPSTDNSTGLVCRMNYI